MSRKNKYKKMKIRKAHSFMSLILFMIMSVLLFAVVAIVTTVIATLSIGTKVATEEVKLHQMQKIYNSELPDYAERLKEFEMDYFITDKNGKVLESYGKDTCVREQMITYEAIEGNEPVTLYLDKDNEILYFEDNEVKFRPIKTIQEADVSLFDDEEERHKEIMLPVWGSVELEKDGRILYAKLKLKAEAETIVMSFAILFSIGAISILLFIVMLINTLRNISVQNRLFRMFYTDVTTSGNNREGFFKSGTKILKKYKNRKNEYAFVNIIMVNYLNFCLSHSVKEGEKLICEVYRLLNNSLARNELMAHFGSGEFELLLKTSDEKEIQERINRLLPAIEDIGNGHRNRYHMGGYVPHNLTGTTGIMCKNKKLDIAEAYNNTRTARETLYGMEASGLAFFDAKLIEEKKWEEAVNDRQQAALEHEEFVVYYQPKYDPKTNTLMGAEALIRWQSPEFGFVTPYKFIPIFEKNGFITEIDHYMLAHVARDQRKWLDAGYSCVPVSVNVSRAHFVESDLAEQILQIVDTAGTPHELIEIELTESAFFDDKDAIVRTINKLKAYGFVVSMDDFGSGYSSLNSLKDMPLDVLKLDAEFFRGENEGDRGRIVVSEAIRLAKSLNMRTVAEGVEIKEQVDFLAGQNCDMIQGYYFAKPMPGAEYEERMREKDKAQKAKEAEMVLYESLSGGAENEKETGSRAEALDNEINNEGAGENYSENSDGDHSGGIGAEKQENLSESPVNGKNVSGNGERGDHSGEGSGDGDHSGGIGAEKPEVHPKNSESTKNTSGNSERGDHSGEGSSDGDHSGGIGAEKQESAKNGSEASHDAHAGNVSKRTGPRR